MCLADMKQIEQRAYNPNQPRDDLGRWTSGGSFSPLNSISASNRPAGIKPIGTQVAFSNIGQNPAIASDTASAFNLPGQAQIAQLRGDDANPTPQLVQLQGDAQYSPDKTGYHEYIVGPNLICSAEERCSNHEIKDYMSRFAVPDQNPQKPITHNSMFLVFIPNTIIPIGNVTTKISEDGFTTENKTVLNHLFHDGIVTRQAIQEKDGSWFVTTRGVGNNIYPGVDKINQDYGPIIFDRLDAQMREYVRQRNGKAKSTVSAISDLECGSIIVQSISSLMSGIDHA